MIQTETNLVVADNSGARSVRVFRIYGGSHRKSCSVGDIVLSIASNGYGVCRCGRIAADTGIFPL